MPGYILNSTQETVSYKKGKNAVEEKQDAEILISSSFEENQGSEENKRSFSQLKICFYPASIFITLLVILVTVGTLYYSTNISQGSLNGSCVPLQRVRKVVIVTERTDFTSCSDNKTCHLFLDVIKQKHDGLKYNFVIGQRGELFIGAGYNCLINSDENALYVKLLESETWEPFDEYLKMCFRLSEIISHGVFCDKISPDYAIQDEQGLCGISESGKNKFTKLHHVHDPGHEVKLIHGDFGWTVCGSFSSTINMEKDNVITLENSPENSCSPLQLVDEIIVDVVETSPFDCSEDPSCLRTFEEFHDGLSYNFIIGHQLDVYVGLGFNCKAESTSDNILKIKVLRQPYSRIEAWDEHTKILQIIEEGIACGRISKVFSVKVKCNFNYYMQNLSCNGDYDGFRFDVWIKIRIEIMTEENSADEYYNITSGHGRGVIPRGFKYQFCHREHSSDNSTSLSDSMNEQSTTPSEPYNYRDDVEDDDTYSTSASDSMNEQSTTPSEPYNYRDDVEDDDTYSTSASDSMTGQSTTLSGSYYYRDDVEDDDTHYTSVSDIMTEQSTTPSESYNYRDEDTYFDYHY